MSAQATSPLTPLAARPRDGQPQPYTNLPAASINRTPSTIKPKPDRYDNVFKGGLGPDAPPKDLPFPMNANITACELITFLPQCLTSADAVYRFVSNGATRQTLWVMVNAARDLPKEYEANRVGMSMYKAMHEAGFRDWTIKKHDFWHKPRKADWDETILNVTGYRTASTIQGKDVEEGDMPFRSLAVGVRRLPQGLDALDLTRMVQYCVQNPEEEWMYPRDYGVLCNHIGGPVQIHKEQTDRAIFNRWAAETAPPPRLWSTEEKEAAIRAMDSKLKKNQDRSVRRATGRRKKQETPMPEESELQDTPQSEGHSRGVESATRKRSRQASPTPVTQRKTRGRPRKQSRLEELGKQNRLGELGKQSSLEELGKQSSLEELGKQSSLEELGFDEEEEREDDTTKPEQYIRAPAAYVAPPKVATTPSKAAIDLAFAAGHDAGETDPFSAYAFGGPRHQPPYRMLHDVQQPNKADISGWAENLRWAWEQRACFWHTFETEGWNESPAHMGLIARTRQRQVWASDELLELLPEDEEEQLED